MAETIGKILLSYDVNGEHDAVKSILIRDYNYSDVGLNLPTNRIYTFPSTTLRHQNKQVSQAIKDLELVCNHLEVNLEKAIAVLTSEEVAYYNSTSI